jgi:hypothetical protein
MVVGSSQYFKADSLNAVALSARRHPARFRLLPLATTSRIELRRFGVSALQRHIQDFHRRSGEPA